MNNRAEMNDRSYNGENGFALASLIFVIMVVSIVTGAALGVANDEQASGYAIRESTGAFYAANSGLAAGLGGWDQAARDADLLALGDSVDLGWTTLENGARYRTVIRLIGSGALKLYSLNVTGRTAGERAQRTLRLHLAQQLPDICCTSAIKGGVGEEARLDDDNNGGVTVSGYDTIPSGWDAVCDSEKTDKAGLEWGIASDVQVENGATLEGAPALVIDPSITTANLFDWGTLDYDSLAAMADIYLSSDEDWDADDIYPRLSSGTCNTGHSMNWGAPENASHDCFDYFPIIHANQDLRIRNGNGAGQGILLVDEELRIENGFRWYGIILHKGEGGKEIRLEDDVQVYGGVISGDRVRIDDYSSVQYSRCATERALSGAGLANVWPLPERAWEQSMF